MNLLAQHGHISSFASNCYLTICVMALACHAKTSFTDPGCVPASAVPLYNQRYNSIHALCGHCQSYKPVNSHHCRICNRCISHMDHHCPWMNNCVGAGNMSMLSIIAVRENQLVCTLLTPAFSFARQNISYCFYVTLGPDVRWPC
jgi:hypothetical protein